MADTPTLDPGSLTTLLDDLTRARQAATALPWVAGKHGTVVGGPVQQFANGEGQQQLWMALGQEWMRPDERDANVALLVLAVNALPTIERLLRDYATVTARAAQLAKELQDARRGRQQIVLLAKELLMRAEMPLFLSGLAEELAAGARADAPWRAAVADVKETQPEELEAASEAAHRCMVCGARRESHDDLRDGVPGHAIHAPEDPRLHGVWHPYTPPRGCIPRPSPRRQAELRGMLDAAPEGQPEATTGPRGGACPLQLPTCAWPSCGCPSQPRAGFDWATGRRADRGVDMATGPDRSHVQILVWPPWAAMEGPFYRVVPDEPPRARWARLQAFCHESYPAGPCTMDTMRAFYHDVYREAPPLAEATDRRCVFCGGSAAINAPYCDRCYLAQRRAGLDQRPPRPGPPSLPAESPMDEEPATEGYAPPMTPTEVLADVFHRLGGTEETGETVSALASRRMQERAAARDASDRRIRDLEALLIRARAEWRRLKWAETEGGIIHAITAALGGV